MDKPRIDAITERLERLERDNRRLKGIGAVALVGVALLAAGGAKLADAPKVIEAERFVVRDPDGKARASLSAGGITLIDGDGKTRGALLVFKDGSPSLALSDQAGTPRATLVVDPDGEPHLTLSDKDGNSRVNLTVESDGNSSLSFSDQKDEPRLQLIVRPEMAALFVRGPDGKPSLSIVASALGEGGLVFAKRGGGNRMSLGITRDGVPSLILTDAAKNGRFILSTKDGAPGIVFFDERKRARLMLEPDADGTPRLQLFDQGEKVLFEAPAGLPKPK